LGDVALLEIDPNLPTLPAITPHAHAIASAPRRAALMGITLWAVVDFMVGERKKEKWGQIPTYILYIF
jgi:hypothetical protein